MVKCDILVTGGAGLIGSEFAGARRVTKQQYDLTVSTQVDQMFCDHQPELVIHTAARVGGIQTNINQIAEFYRDNVLINTNVIDYAHKHGVKRMICFLSTCIFPDNVEYPLTESMIHHGPPHISNFGYAYAKRMCGVQLDAYNQQYDTQYFAVIPTNMYGPNDNYNLASGHVLPALIHKCYLAKLNNTDLEVWGSGKPLREFIYSKDVAKLCLKLLDTYSGTGPVILSGSQEISIGDLALLICDRLQFKNRIRFDTSKPDGQYRKSSSNQRLMSIIKEFDFTPIEQGLDETIEHVVKNFKHVRK
jgi:GDP-L-fucose synthase